MSSTHLELESLEQRQLLQALPISFSRVNLVSDQPDIAITTDENLKNAWGVVVNPDNDNIWVASNGTGTLIEYTGDGEKVTEVAVPEGAAGLGAAPTGLVFNDTEGFVIGSNGDSAPATLLAASEDGTISAWNPDVAMGEAQLVVDNSEQGAVYKGLTIARMDGDNFIYAANFSNGTVDVFDSDFNPVTLSSNAFQDRRIPGNYAPFNVQNVGNRIFVTYAMQDEAKRDDVPGRGHGFVDVFNPDGRLVNRFASRGTLNSPWAVLPISGRQMRNSPTVLIGNFGNGLIFAYQGQINPGRGSVSQAMTRVEPVVNLSGRPIRIDGLWGLALRPGGDQSVRATVVFASGPNDEQDALVGFLITNRRPFFFF